METYDQVEAGRVKVYTGGRLLKLLAEIHLETISTFLVRPDSHCAVRAARCEELLLNARIKADDLLAVKGGDEILVLLLGERSFKIDVDFDDLARVCCKYNCVHARRKRHAYCFMVHHVLVEHSILAFVFGSGV